MPESPKTKKTQIASAQRYLNIQEIRDDCIVLRDGSLRAALLVSSINFALKAEEEQEAVVAAYVQFLNSLNFPLQIVIQSRELNIDDYLKRLKLIEKEQTNDLLRMQTQEYRQYITELVELSEIMSKKFYVIVPYAPGKGGTKKFIARLQDVVSPTSIIHLKQKKFDEYRGELLKRVDYTASGLASVSLNSAVLDTQSLIELFYNTYNPEISKQEELVDVGKLNIET